MKIYSLAFLCCMPIISGLLFQFPYAFPTKDSPQKLTKNKPAVSNIVFKSDDGGKTWQDMSKGLPQNMQEAGFFANESGVYLRAGQETFHSKQNSIAPEWKKEIFPYNWSSIAAGKNGIFAYNYEGEILQRINGTTVWSPVYKNFKGRVRTVFETAGGTVFIGTANGLFKSTNKGKTWKHVHVEGWVIKLAEQNGVLVATSMKGIIRSADDGENWTVVISEGGVGIDVAPIKGGFAAITFNTQSNTRRIRTSYDGGKAWQPIDAGLQVQTFLARFGNPFSQFDASDSVWHPANTGLPDQAFITSIIQVGEYFFCGHPKGIFRSADKGKTWKLILPSVENKVFNLTVSGNVIYAIARNGGC